MDHQSPFAGWAQPEINQTTVLDRFSRVTQQGDAVMALGKQDVVWRVTGTRPIMARDAPPGLVEVHLVATLVFHCQGGMPVGELIKVKDVSELKPLPGAETPPDEGQDPGAAGGEGRPQ